MIINPLDLLPGAIFGFAMNRGRVVEPSIVAGQMTFDHFVMLKMFLSALGSSLLIFGYFYGTGKFDAARQQQMCSRKNKTLDAVLIGCGLLGVGMAISASCPGSVYAQLGSLNLWSVVTLLGCLVGAASYHIVGLPLHFGNHHLPAQYHHMANVVNNLKPDLNLTPQTFGFAAGGALLALTVVLEVIVNWRKDLSGLYPETAESFTFFFYASPAIISGVLIGGVAQFLSLHMRDQALGVSFTFTELLQLAYQHILPKIFPQTSAEYKAIAERTPQIIRRPEAEPLPISAVAMILGSLLASITAPSISVGLSAVDFAVHPVMFFLRSFFGGILIAYGASIAGGCTSGMGLSGAGSGSTLAFIGTGAMFGMAIFTGMLMKYTIPTAIIAALLIGAIKFRFFPNTNPTITWVGVNGNNNNNNNAGTCAPAVQDAVDVVEKVKSAPKALD